LVFAPLPLLRRERLDCTSITKATQANDMRITLLTVALAMLFVGSDRPAAMAHGAGGFGRPGFGHPGFGHPGFRNRFRGRVLYGNGFPVGGVIDPYYGGSAPASYAPPAPCQETVTVQAERGGTAQVTITRCAN
jgi:hypothetical protein